MTPDQFKARTQRFALNIIEFVSPISGGFVMQHIAKQLVRSGTSVGANYRAACRARSSAEMVSKLGIVLEEVDESAYWLELLSQQGVAGTDVLHREADEIAAMVTASINTLRGKSVREDVQDYDAGVSGAEPEWFGASLSDATPRIRIASISGPQSQI